MTGDLPELAPWQQKIMRKHFGLDEGPGDECDHGGDEMLTCYRWRSEAMIARRRNRDDLFVCDGGWVRWAIQEPARERWVRVAFAPLALHAIVHGAAKRERQPGDGDGVTGRSSVAAVEGLDLRRNDAGLSGEMFDRWEVFAAAFTNFVLNCEGWSRTDIPGPCDSMPVGKSCDPAGLGLVVWQSLGAIRVGL